MLEQQIGSQIWNFFFSLEPNQILGTIINVAILLLGFYALVQLLGALGATRRESAVLREFDGRVRGRRDPNEILRQAQSINAPILTRRLEILRDLLEAGADIDQGSLAGLALAELDGKAGRARWIAGTTVLLGLGGTLIGLSQAVLQAQPMLGEIMNGAGAIKAVVGTFSGLATAFSTTLMGIFWAVLLGLLITLLRSRQSAFLQQLEQVTLVRLIPNFRTSPAKAMVEAARTLSALETHIATALTEIIGQLRTQGLALTKVVEDSLGAVVDEARSTGKGLVQAVDGSVLALVRETQDRGLGLTNTVDRSFTTLSEDLRSGTTDILGRLEATHVAMARLLGEPGADSFTLAQNLEVLRQGVSHLASAGNRLNEMAPHLEEVIARQVDRQSRDLHETMHSYTRQLSENVARQESIVGQGFTRLEGGVGAFGDALLESLREHEGALLGKVGLSVDKVAAAAENQAAQVAALGQASQDLVVAASALQSHENSEPAHARLAQQVATLASILERLDDRLRQPWTGATRIDSAPAVATPVTRLIPDQPRLTHPSTDGAMSWRREEIDLQQAPPSVGHHTLPPPPPPQRPVTYTSSPQREPKGFWRRLFGGD